MLWVYTSSDCGRRHFTLDGYKTIIHTQRLYRPFINSVITTVLGTFLGLLLSTLGGYVLIQFDMPGRNFFAYFLLFTMIFSGGMIPEYLVMKQLHLVNSMWILVVKHGMNVYNLVLMRNFFEGIPASLFEAAEDRRMFPYGNLLQDRASSVQGSSGFHRPDVRSYRME